MLCIYGLARWHLPYLILTGIALGGHVQCVDVCEIESRVGFTIPREHNNVRSVMAQRYSWLLEEAGSQLLWRAVQEVLRLDCLI